MGKSSLAFALGLAVAWSAALAQTIQPPDPCPTPSWPALKRQLAADRVVAGSALESLVEANQDFGMLRPEEALDRIPVPLWLRVLWRRAHPEGRYSAADPTGGYPHVLKEIHEWLVSHQDLLPGLPEPAVLAAPAERAGPGRANQRISGLFEYPRSESDIRIFQGDPRRVIAASNNIGGSGAQAQYWSTDGGATWSRSELPLLPQDGSHSDPTVDWTSDGTAWATTIGVSASGFDGLRLRLYRSTDGGATWVYDSTFSGRQNAADKQMVWIDHSTASPFRDSIYAIWHNDEPIYMNRRRNGAWAAPVKVSGAETTGSGIGGDVKTNGAGVVFGLWPDSGSQKIYMVRSTNGGDSYGKPAAVASTYDSYDIGLPAQVNRRALIYVSAGAWRTAAKNLVYAAWTDLSGAPGCAKPANEPRNNAASTCQTRIWYARSTNGGVTWGRKRMLNDRGPAQGKHDQFNQALVVDEASGAVAVVYYDTMGDPARRATNLWYQASFDDGATWGAPFKVTTAATSEAGGGADLGNQYGDYNGLTGWAGKFLPVWTDRRRGRSEEVWMATVADARKVADPGVDATAPPATAEPVVSPPPPW